MLVTTVTYHIRMHDKMFIIILRAGVVFHWALAPPPLFRMSLLGIRITHLLHPRFISQVLVFSGLHLFL